MWNCADCGDRFKDTQRRCEDPRDEPLDEGYCLCVNCFRGACRDAIETKLHEIEELTDTMATFICEDNS